jgi:hypothetical protein
VTGPTRPTPGELAARQAAELDALNARHSDERDALLTRQAAEWTEPEARP